MSRRPRAHAGQRLDDQRKAVGEVIARTTVEPHLCAGLAGDDPEAVVLDFVQPLAAGRQLVGFGWKARRDEPGREGDPPPLKWSDLRYVFDIKEDCNGKEAIQA